MALFLALFLLFTVFLWADMALIKCFIGFYIASLLLVSAAILSVVFVVFLVI